MQAFCQSSNFVVNNSTFVDNSVSVANGLRNLYQHAARGASHDSKDQYDAPKCHPDTRKQLLADTHEWAKLKEKETGIRFLQGPAGTGKSCIARSVCQQAVKEGLLGASFFFWRSASDRNNASKLVTTLSYQLAKVNDELGRHIIAQLERNPEVVDMSLEDQFRILIYEPCISVPRDKLVVTMIVIDGLDECVDHMMQVGILQLLAKAVRYEEFPLGFFITSRPELHIQEALNSKEIIFAMHCISLDRTTGVSQDITTVLQSGFSLIFSDPRFKMALRSVSRPWPSPQSIKKLVQRSSGQFIYAATVMKFMSNPNHNPDAQLQIVLGIKDSNKSSPLADLDLLYREILSRVQDTERTIKVLGYLITLKLPVSTLSKLTNTILARAKAIVKAVNYNQHRLLLVIEQLLDLPQGEAYFALNQLHSVLDLKVGSESFRRHSEIKFHHRSFHDFLTTKKRSREFYVNAVGGRGIVQSCLKIMSLPKYETKELHVGWIYAYHLWISLNARCHTTTNLQNFNIGLKRYFFGFPDVLDPLLLKPAFELLGLPSDRLDAGGADVHDPLSEEERDNMVFSGIEALKRMRPQNEEHRAAHERYIRETFFFPLLMSYAQPYQNDMMVKKALMLLSFMLPHEYDRCNMILSSDDTGFTFDLAPTRLHQYLDQIGEANLKIFLADREYSGTYCCTEDDWDILNFQQQNWERQLNYSYIAQLKHHDLTITPEILGIVKSVVLNFIYSWGYRGLCDLKFEGDLLTWLKNLPNPPQKTIDAWEVESGIVEQQCRNSLKLGPTTLFGEQAAIPIDKDTVERESHITEAESTVGDEGKEEDLLSWVKELPDITHDFIEAMETGFKNTELEYKNGGNEVWGAVFENIDYRSETSSDGAAATQIEKGTAEKEFLIGAGDVEDSLSWDCWV